MDVFNTDDFLENFKTSSLDVELMGEVLIVKFPERNVTMVDVLTSKANFRKLRMDTNQ